MCKKTSVGLLFREMMLSATKHTVLGRVKLFNATTFLSWRLGYHIHLSIPRPNSFGYTVILEKINAKVSKDHGDSIVSLSYKKASAKSNFYHCALSKPSFSDTLKANPPRLLTAFYDDPRSGQKDSGLSAQH